MTSKPCSSWPKNITLSVSSSAACMQTRMLKGNEKALINVQTLPFLHQARFPFRDGFELLLPSLTCVNTTMWCGLRTLGQSGAPCCISSSRQNQVKEIWHSIMPWIEDGQLRARLFNYKEGRRDFAVIWTLLGENIILVSSTVLALLLCVNVQTLKPVFWFKMIHHISMHFLFLFLSCPLLFCVSTLPWERVLWKVLLVTMTNARYLPAVIFFDHIFCFVSSDEHLRLRKVFLDLLKLKQEWQRPVWTHVQSFLAGIIKADCKMCTTNRRHCRILI